MENFDPRPNAVKEKNLYIVHLDTPRIIILSSVVIGIITAAFLLGMTFMKDDKQDTRKFANSSMNFDESRAADILKSDIPPMSMGDDYNSNEDRMVSADENKTLYGETVASGRDEIKHDKTDILTSANIKEIIPPASEKTTPVKQEKKVVNTADNNKKVAAAPKDNKNNAKQGNVNDKSNVHGVSHNVDGKKQGTFAIQVASYGNISRAEQERSVLKSKNYDAYIDKGLVNGKDYFRLRVGPVSSSKEAYSLLSELQSDSRYSESYIVTE